jgi:flagellar hook-length control protein FliK
MNATPTALPVSTMNLQAAGCPPSDPACADTPFSQLLSNEIAQQNPGDERMPGAGADLVALLSTLAETPEDPMADIDPAAALPARTDVPIQPVSAETLLGLCMPYTSTAQALATPAHAGQTGGTNDFSTRHEGVPTIALQTDATPLLASVSRNMPASRLDAPASAELLPATSMLGTLGSPERLAATTAPESEFSTDAFALRLAAESGRSGEAPTDLLNAAPLRAATAPSAADTGPATNTSAAPRLAPEVGTSAWGQALGEKIVWMAKGSQQSASLTLNPPNLGPLQVVLNVTNDQATASFFAVQPEVRQAIEDALPRLREMMGDAGIQLGQASVSADTPSQSAPSQDQASNPATSSLAAGEEAAESGLASAPRAGRGLVDTFA